MAQNRREGGGGGNPGSYMHAHIWVTVYPPLHFATFPNFKYWMGLGFRVVQYNLGSSGLRVQAT